MILSILAINSADGQFISAIVMDPQAANAGPEINIEPINAIDPIKVMLNKRFNLRKVLSDFFMNVTMVSPFNSVSRNSFPTRGAVPDEEKSGNQTYSYPPIFDDCDSVFENEITITLPGFMKPIRSIPKTQIADFCPDNCLLSPIGKANSYFVQFVFRTNRQEFKSGIPVYDNRE